MRVLSISSLNLTTAVKTCAVANSFAVCHAEKLILPEAPFINVTPVLQSWLDGPSNHWTLVFPPDKEFGFFLWQGISAGTFENQLKLAMPGFIRQRRKPTLLQPDRHELGEMEGIGGRKNSTGAVKHLLNLRLSSINFTSVLNYKK